MTPILRPFFLFLFICGAVYGIEGVDASLQYNNVTSRSCYVEDPSRSMDFEPFEAKKKDMECTIDGGAAGFVFSSSAYWFYFTIDNREKSALKRLLAFEPTWLDKIDIRLVSPTGSEQHFRGGDRYPFSERAFQHPRTVFTLDLDPGISTVTVRLETRDPFVVVMELWEERAFYSADGKYLQYIGFLYGVLIAMVIYNLFLFFSIRDRINLFYVLYVFSFLAMNFTYSGFAFPYLWPDYPEWANWAHSILIYFFTLSGLLFATVFLDTKGLLPRLHKWIIGYIGVVAAFFILTIFTGGYAHHVVTAIFFVVPFSLIAFILGIVSWVNGNRTARFFILATTAGLIGASVTAFTVSSLLPFSFLTYRAADIGMLFDAMLLSLAVADRYRILRRERDTLRFKEMQQDEVIRQKEAFAVRLEERVQEELQKNRQQERIMLKQYQQAALGNMIGVIAHQLKQPLNAIGLYIQNMAESYRFGELTNEGMETAQSSVWNSIQFMSRTIDDFRNFFRPDKKRQSFMLGEAVEKVLALLNQQVMTLNVQIDVVSAHPIRVTSHENEIQQVLLNLLNNAFDILKERRIDKPYVRIGLTEADGNAFIDVEDNGGGISKESLPHMFELYYTTKGEAGTGLGLYMSRMIMTESLGGEISVENGENGARFRIRLPLS